MLKHSFVFFALLQLAMTKIDLNRNGCGDTKGCLFKPAGCNPDIDCTIAIIFYVSEPNRLTIQMVAQTLLPTPNYQYIAIGFSKDSFMGEDFVSECVLSPSGNSFVDVEVFSSYNNGQLNDRTYLNQTERSILYDEIESDITDGRLACQFRQQIVPQIPSKNGKIWNLNNKFYIIAATGTSQLDEINVHDTSQGSHFYPIVTARPINPALIGQRLYDLPLPYPEPKVPKEDMLTTTEIALNDNNVRMLSMQMPPQNSTNSADKFCKSLILFISFFFLFF